MTRQIKKKQDYLGKLLKLIPSEIIAVYVATQGFIPEEKWGLAIVTLFLFFLTPLYLRFVQKVKRPAQIVVSALSFMVWVYCLGGPFAHFEIHNPKVASVILLIWTTFIPRFFDFEPEGN